jgi:hypothetical protein
MMIMQFQRMFALFAPVQDLRHLAGTASADATRAALHRALRAELQRPEPDWARVAEIERALAPQGQLGHVELRIAGDRWDEAIADGA